LRSLAPQGGAVQPCSLFFSSTGIILGVFEYLLQTRRAID
jgi:hypothetical protein